MPKPIDRVTWRRWRWAVEDARRLGRPLAEVLNERALILTSERVKTLKGVALRDAANALENANVRQIIDTYGGSGNSALDMQRGVVAWLRARAEREESRD